jgi:hypothetical protein
LAQRLAVIQVEFHANNAVIKFLGMGCEGCFQTEKAMQEALINIQHKAKAYAVEHKKNVFVYRSDGGELSFMEEEAARSFGINPVVVVSFLQPVTT